jgi:hypothetical protein
MNAESARAARKGGQAENDRFETDFRSHILHLLANRGRAAARESLRITKGSLSATSKRQNYRNCQEQKRMVAARPIAQLRKYKSISIVSAAFRRTKFFDLFTIETQGFRCSQQFYTLRGKTYSGAELIPDQLRASERCSCSVSRPAIHTKYSA